MNDIEKRDYETIVDILDKALANLKAIKTSKPTLKYFRVWMKKSKDAIDPDYFIDTLAENATMAGLWAELYAGDYVDLVCVKENLRRVK